jgi:Protein of unknown function (DUF3307)
MISGSAAAFAAVFIALWIAHTVGDHWLQTSTQSADKGKPGWPGRFADSRHVLTLTLAKVALLAVTAAALDLHLAPAAVAAGLAVDSASHWWADRRSTLARFAAAVGKREFFELGTAAHPDAPVAADGTPAAHIGSGQYALDQSFHAFFLFLAALIITTVHI